MSRFCGKCDYYDHIYGMDADRLSLSKVYLNEKIVDCSTEKNRALYYPFIISSGCFNKNGDVIYLSSKSYITEHEEEILKILLDRVISVYNYFKKKDIEFTFKNVLDKLGYLADGIYRSATEKICNRVKESRKANIVGIHISDGVETYYRSEWKRELIRVGWTEEEANNWINKY